MFTHLRWITIYLQMYWFLFTVLCTLYFLIYICLQYKHVAYYCYFFLLHTSTLVYLLCIYLHCIAYCILHSAKQFCTWKSGWGLDVRGIYIWLKLLSPPPTPHCADSEKRRGEVGSLPPLFTFKGTVATHRRFHVILRTHIYENQN